jgi:hypothetical protein
MLIVCLFLCMVLLVAAGVAILAHRLLRRFGHGPALLVAGAVFGGAVLFFPIPIHGGFTLLIEVLLDELQSQADLRRLEQKDENRAAFLASLESRFGEPLAYEILDRPQPGWAIVDTVGGQAWLAEESHLIWGRLLIWPQSAGLPTLDDVERLCREQPPQGCWALPTEAEYYHFWQAGGERILPDEGYGRLSSIVDIDLQQKLPSYRLGPRGFALRCVARTAESPVRGYLQEDIPREEWNRYQLARLSGGRATPLSEHLPRR